ncbi:MAG TPA: SDR family NAD(P)-dependent oxidoreductase, partial [Labilithrix sp.]|nr:SDR family NAD(P)-dependent oxidoreductase [Labilithrix sp.]
MPEIKRARCALVTGASRGIGAAIARCLARDGFDVVLNCRDNRELAESVAEEIRAIGRAATVSVFDVTDAAATSKALEGLLERGIDVLVNNAGI